MAARNAENVFDAGLRQHPRDQDPRRQFLGQHPLDRHHPSSRLLYGSLPPQRRELNRTATGESGLAKGGGLELPTEIPFPPDPRRFAMAEAEHIDRRRAALI